MAIDIPNVSLSANDKQILSALFDPETLPSSVAQAKEPSAIDPSLQPHPWLKADQLSELEREQNQIVQRISSSSDLRNIVAAIAELDATISIWPNYPSAYVNRAMLRRMKLEASMKENQNIFVASASEIEALFTDLARVIHLSLPAESSTAPVSTYCGRMLRTAYSHRAYLYLKAVETDTKLNGLGESELEELASKDFAAAARYGDEVAREMSVRTNPYAKMCGAIVRNALAEERKGDHV